LDDRFKRLRGMPDLVPADMPGWHALEAAIASAMSAYGYAELRTPLIEKTTLFERSIGEATDIVEKEMYTLQDRKGERISLRPENTVGVVRAVLENGLVQPGAVARLFYRGPMFRYERPQLGRQRQFHQAGAEVFGLAGPVIEAELVLLSARLFRDLGLLDSLQLEMNTLGTGEDRATWRAALVAHFEAHRDQLDEDSLRRLSRNPMRILDSKNPALQSLIEAAPTLDDSLCEESRAHFDTLRELLAANGIQAQVNPRLVRGLDYYSHTVFEWTTDRLGAQSAVCGGGRYDKLIDELGGKPMPAVGWAMGMERIVALMTALERVPAAGTPDVFLIVSDEVPAAIAFGIAERLRAARPALSVVHNVGGGSMKSQFKRADKSGARVALVVGAEELAQDAFTLKPLQGGEQQRVASERVPAAIDALLAGLRTVP